MAPNQQTSSWQAWSVAAAIFVAVVGLGYVLNRDRDKPVKAVVSSVSTRVHQTDFDIFFTDASEITVVDAPKRIAFKGVEFADQAATLQPQSMKALDEVAVSMKEHPEVRISLEGHVDATGDTGRNKELSLARATAARRALIARGIAAGRIEVVGWGNEKELGNRLEIAVIGVDLDQLAH